MGSNWPKDSSCVQKIAKPGNRWTCIETPLHVRWIEALSVILPVGHSDGDFIDGEFISIGN